MEFEVKPGNKYVYCGPGPGQGETHTVVSISKSDEQRFHPFEILSVGLTHAWIGGVVLFLKQFSQKP